MRHGVNIQLLMSDRKRASPRWSRNVSRVGINLGYIIIDGDDIYADGVNVAARLDTWPSRRAGISAQEAVTVLAKSQLGTDSPATK